MEEEIKHLKQENESLRSELEASAYREKLLADPDRNAGFLKRAIKKTALGRMASDPNSKIGKVVRSPRSAIRIMLHPSIIKDIKKKNNPVESNDIFNAFAPVKFFISEGCDKRINLLVSAIDENYLKMGIQLANDRKLELRVITYGEEAASMKYRELVKKKKIQAAKKISFYSSVDQAVKKDCFMLEVNKDDVFITSLWSVDEKTTER
jgi:hypothetical protein